MSARGAWVATVLAVAMLMGARAAAAQPGTTLSAADPPAVTACEALLGGRFNTLEHAPTEIIRADYIAQTPSRRAHCLVEGYVNPQVGFGMLMPAENWNGKLLFRGCGGSCGGTFLELNCAKHLRDGYACVATDMGHHSSSTDNNWAAGDVSAQIDFGFRATHVATLAGKAVVRAFYGKDPRISYFFGCSTGGRQGLMEAQRFPGDFDGIVVVAPVGGAPAIDLYPIDPNTLNFDPSGRPIVPPRKIYMLHRAVLASCDGNDGLKDGVINNPLACRFDPATVACASGDAPGCLTSAQLDVVRRIYASGAVPGSETTWVGKSILLHPVPIGSGPYAQSRGDPVITPSLFSADNPDLRRFEAHGGKLIAVQGWDDPQVDPRRVIDYYRVTTAAMGGPAATRAFFRLFMVPGMEHCSTGEGAYGINYIAELEHWFEAGVPPERLIGVKPKPGAPLDFYNVDLPLLKPDEIAFSRPHYAWPKAAAYAGHGDPTKAESFVGR